MNATTSFRLQRYGDLLGAVVLLAGCDVTGRTVDIRRGNNPQREAGTDGAVVETGSGGAMAAAGGGPAAGAPGRGGASGSVATAGRPGAGGSAAGGAQSSA